MNSFISKWAKKHSHKAMILRTTELDVRNMSANLCTRNILDQKLSIFEPYGKVVWPRTYIERKILAKNAQYLLIGLAARFFCKI